MAALKNVKIPHARFLFWLTALIMAVMVSMPAVAAGPVDALKRMAQAVDSGDSVAFEQLVDLDAILDDCLSTFLLEARKPENASRLPPLITMMLSQAPSEGRGAEAIRGLLRQGALLFVRNGISSGAFAGKKLAPSENAGLLAPLFANASIGKKEIRGIGEALPDGNEWPLPFTVHDYGNDRDYPVIGRFSPFNGDLRMTGLDNAAQLLQMILEESQAREI